MADTVFKAFLSCSLQEDDRPVVEFFKRLISALKFDPTVYEEQEVHPLTARIQELIRTSDCLIAVATRRSKIAEAENWTISDWVQQEITFARAYGKPIALLVEAGVQVSGFVDADVRRVVFSREKLLDKVDAIVGYLFSLRAALDETLSARNRVRQITFVRESVHIRESFTQPQITFTGDILMEALEDLTQVHHSSVLDDDTPGLTIRPETFDFRCKDRPNEIAVNTVVLQDTDRRHVWAVLFDPPLKRGQRVRYGFRLISPNFRPFTFEELASRIERKTYTYPDPICNSLDWTVTHPTRDLLFEMEFPADYEITKPRLRVTIGHVDNRDEVERIVSTGGLQVDKLFDAWSIKLRVPNPLYGHNYGIQYVPPKLG